MITAKSLEALYRQAPKREKLATQKLPRIRTPATPLTTVVGCQPLFRDRWSRAGATASVERPDSFTDAQLHQHGVCRRAPGVPCHDVLDGRGTCILLLLLEERLRVQGMR